jgi:ATP-binding protein involved in chromosome partitioning
MSYHICSTCGHQEDIFGHGGVGIAAHNLGVPFLGQIPLHIDIRAAADTGTPLVALNKSHPISKIYQDMAQKIWKSLPAEKTIPRAPKSAQG